MNNIENKRGSYWLAIVACAMALGICVGMIAGYKSAIGSYQAELVRRGLGEWKVVGEKGETEFRFIDVRRDK